MHQQPEGKVWGKRIRTGLVPSDNVLSKTRKTTSYGKTKHIINNPSVKALCIKKPNPNNSSNKKGSGNSLDVVVNPVSQTQYFYFDNMFPHGFGFLHYSWLHSRIPRLGFQYDWIHGNTINVFCKVTSFV